jgi:Protein of unknown function VcgC/VcgE (DUF2780)
MLSRMRITRIAVCFFIYFGVAGAQQAQAQIPSPIAPAADAKNPSPELIGNLTKELSITPAQAIGGTGALFGLAKSRLRPEEFARVSDAVPGMDGLLSAAPKSMGSAGALGALGGALPGQAGGLASVAGSFKSLGLSPGMASKFVPIMTKFVEAKGGAGVGSLLGGALK